MLIDGTEAIARTHSHGLRCVQHEPHVIKTRRDEPPPANMPDGILVFERGCERKRGEEASDRGH